MSVLYRNIYLVKDKLLILHIDDLVPIATTLAFCDIEYSRRGEEGSELVVSVVARIEVRLLLL